MLSLVGWPRRVGSGESPDAVPAIARIDDLQPDVKENKKCWAKGNHLLCRCTYRPTVCFKVFS